MVRLPWLMMDDQRAHVYFGVVFILRLTCDLWLSKERAVAGQIVHDLFFYFKLMRRISNNLVIKLYPHSTLTRTHTDDVTRYRFI